MINWITRGGIDRTLNQEGAELINATARLRGAAAAWDERLEGYRRITKEGSRGLADIDQDRMINESSDLWMTNPLAKRFIEVMKDFMIGGGITYAVGEVSEGKPDDEMKKVLDSFWWESDNNWDLKGEQRVRELGLFGELFLPAWVSPQTGAVRIGYIDPKDVKKVNLNKLNKEVVESVTLKLDGRDGKEITIPVINRDRGNVQGQEALKRAKAAVKREYTKGKRKKEGQRLTEQELKQKKFDTHGRLVGDQSKVGDKFPVGIFYFSVNRLMNQDRGISDLWVVSDWVDAYDKLVFNLLDREALLNAFVWDIECEDFNDDQCEEKELKLDEKPPTPGSYRVHNQKEKWKAITPELKAKDASEAAKLVRLMVSVGTGLPEFWFSLGEDVNRSTAEKMETPAFGMMEQRQKYIKYMLEYMLDFAIDQAYLAGYLKFKGDEDEVARREGVSIKMPNLSKADEDKLSDVLSKVTTALTIGEGNDWIDKADAAEVFVSLVSQFGVDVSPKEVEETVEQQTANLESVSKLNVKWNKYLNDRKQRKLAASSQASA